MFPLRHSNSTHLILPHQPSQAQCIRLLRDDDRLAVLRQSQILDNHNFVIENLQDYDRLVILTQRYFRCDLASLSFFDQDKQWLLSCAGPVVSRPLPEHRMLELTHSLDCYFLSMYSIGENRGTGQIQDSVLTGKYRALEKWLNLNDSARFYAAALIFVDHKPIGVLSIMHFTTRDVLLPEDVLTLKEYADAIASMLKERRDNVLRCQQERANLMLGLNHHLRTPLMSLTVITEMLKCEIESNAGNSFMLSSNSKSFHSDIPFIYSADDEYLSMDEVSPHTPRDTSTPTSSVGSSSTISNQSIDSKKVLTSKESIQLECGIASLSLPTNNNTIHLPGERISSKLPSSHGNHHNNNNPPSTSTSSQNSPIPPAPSSLSALFGSLGGNGSQMPLGSPNVSGKMLQSPSRGGSFTASQLPSLTGSKDTSFYSAHSVSCMSEGTSNQLSLLYDLQCALQQLGLFVEMGLIFGKVTLELTGKHQVAHSQLTKNLSCPSDSSEAHDYEMLYNAKLCDIISVIEKVQLLTQRMQIGSTSIVWDIDELKAIDGDFLVYDDMLLLIMISSLTQLIPHATNIHIKVTISSLTQSSHNTVYKNVYDHIAHNRSKGNLLISFEVRGDSNNLLDMFQQFHCTSSPSSTTQDMYDNSNTSNNSTPMADLGSSIFAFGYLLKNISGSSSFLSTASGGIISFSLPCHIVYHSLINPASPSGKNHSILGLVKQRSFSNSLNESLVKRQSSTNVQLEQSLMSHISNATLYLNASSDSVDDIDEEEQTQSLFLDDFDLERSLSNIQDISASSSVLTKSISNVSLNNHFFPTTSRENSRQLSSRNGLYFEESYDAQKLGILGEDSLDYSCYGDKLSRSNLQSMATKKLKVLMIDDSVTVQKIMNVWLKKKQCEVTQALNGLIGLELLQSQTFDIVLLDFLMPVMDGLTCMQHYHKWRVEHNVQITPWIIGLSATALEKDQELAFEAGLTFFSNKPVDMTALGYILECRRIGLDTLHVKFLMEFTKRNVLDDSQEATWRNILQLSEIISGGGSSHHEQDQKKPKAKLAKKAAPIPNTIFGGFQSYML